MEIDEEIKAKLELLSATIASTLKETGSIFINIQIPEEFSQYDVFFAYNYVSVGTYAF